MKSGDPVTVSPPTVTNSIAQEVFSGPGYTFLRPIPASATTCAVGVERPECPSNHGRSLGSAT